MIGRGRALRASSFHLPLIRITHSHVVQAFRFEPIHRSRSCIQVLGVLLKIPTETVGCGNVDSLHQPLAVRKLSTLCYAKTSGLDPEVRRVTTKDALLVGAPPASFFLKGSRTISACSWRWK